MAKTFRPYNIDQPFLLPPDLREWVPEGHLSLYLSDVVDQLDLGAILRSYERGRGRGQPPYDPRMMVKLLLYAYAIGMFSSRAIEKATWEDVPTRVIASNQHPDHDTVATFRKRHLEALAGLFLQVLMLCREAGLVKLGHVSLDGTKINANASKAKSMSYKRMGKKEQELADKIRKLLKQAEDVDAAEDAQFGRGIAGDELPKDLQKRETRLKRIQEARAALAARDVPGSREPTEPQPSTAIGAETSSSAAQPAQGPVDPDSEQTDTSADGRSKESSEQKVVPDDQLVEELEFCTTRLEKIREGQRALEVAAHSKACETLKVQQAKLEAREKRIRDGLRPGRAPTIPDPEQAKPDPKTQYNFTDPESVIMKDSATKGFAQGYNAQAVVDEGSQIIVATAVRAMASDRQYLKDLIDRVEMNLGRLPDKASADTGFFSKENIKLDGTLDLYIPPERARRSQEPPKPGTRPAKGPAVDAMREKLRSPEGKATYAKRKQTVEPVFGQIKGARRFRMFSLRGLANVTAEWDLVSLTHNILKLFRSGWRALSGASSRENQGERAVVREVPEVATRHGGAFLALA